MMPPNIKPSNTSKLNTIETHKNFFLNSCTLKMAINKVCNFGNIRL